MKAKILLSGPMPAAKKTPTAEADKSKPTGRVLGPHINPFSAAQVLQLQNTCGNASVMRMLAGRIGAPASIQRDVILPPDEIRGSEKPDDETQKVMASIANTTTRAMGYLNRNMSEIIMAVDAFKGAAQSQIDALEGDPSDLTGAIGPLLGVIGGVVSGIFPPAAGFVIGTTFITSMANASAIAGIKSEGGKVKQSLKDGMQAFATTVSNVASAAIAGESSTIATRLTNMAAMDSNIWNMMVIGGERQINNVIIQLQIPDPEKQSPYGVVLKALMVPFGSWLEKQKYEMGKTNYEKLVAESLPGEQSFKDLHNKMKEGESSGVEQSRKMTEEHMKLRQ